MNRNNEQLDHQNKKFYVKDTVKRIERTHMLQENICKSLTGDLDSIKKSLNSVNNPVRIQAHHHQGYINSKAAHENIFTSLAIREIQIKL